MVRANNFRPPTRSKKNRQTNRNYRVSNDRPDGGHDGDRGEDLPDLLRADALGEQSARHGVLKLYVYIFLFSKKDHLAFLGKPNHMRFVAIYTWQMAKPQKNRVK